MKSLLQQLFKVLFLHHNFTKMHIILWNIYPDEVTLSRTQSLYGEIRQNRHSRRICRIRQNCQFVGTPISSSIALWRNSSKSPCSPNSPDSSKLPLHQYPYLELNRSLPDSSKSPLRRYPYLELNRSSEKFRQNRHSRQIRRIRQNRRFVGTPISSSITLWRNCRYPYLELNRSSAIFSQNRHSHRIRRICQIYRFVGTPISGSIALR